MLVNWWIFSDEYLISKLSLKTVKTIKHGSNLYSILSLIFVSFIFMSSVFYILNYVNKHVPFATCSFLPH